MKSVLLVLFLVLFVFHSLAQENSKRKVHIAFEIGEKIFSEYSDQYDEFNSFRHGAIMAPVEWTVYLGHRINKHHEINLGQTLFDGFFQGAYCMPTLLDYRYYFKEEANSLYGYGGAGYTFISDPSIKCTNYRFGIGYRFKLYQKLNGNVSIGYDFTPIYDHYKFEEDQTISALNFKVGFGF